MATTIEIDYTPQFAGSHRICYRVEATPANTYCCLVDATASTIGVPKTYVITVGDAPCASVPEPNTESCNPTVYQGYVQPVCESEESLVARVAWSVEFDLVPSCTEYEIQCINSGVQGITITAAGTAYNPMSPPAITIDAPTGSGPVQATAVALVGDGSASAGFIVTQGLGYTNGVYANVPMLGGTGSGLLATVVITLTQISSITITNGGTGYVIGDVLAPDTGVVGVPAPAGSYQISNTNLGKITGATMTNKGAGYIVVPAVAIAAGPGDDATGTASMKACAAFAGVDCTGADVDPNVSIPFLETKSMCATTEPVIASVYSVTEIGPCCTCVEYTISVVNMDALVPQIYWTQCNAESGRDLVAVTNKTFGYTVVVCAIEGSVGVTPGQESNVAILVTGSCDS